MSMKDVAAAAGVSYQTVSRVLNGSPAVRTDTRRRIVDAIDSLGYKPDIAAQALASGKRTTLGIVNLGRHGYGPSLIEDAVRREASLAGVRTVVSSADGRDKGDIERAFQDVLLERVASLIVIGDAGLATVVADALAPGMPVVYTDTLDGDLGAESPQYAGAALATRHLISLGHRHIGHITGATGSVAARQRHRGWADACEAAGLSSVNVVTGSWSEDTGYAAAVTLLADQDLTALFVANDAMAFGAMHAADDLGLRVPIDLSVIGFDDTPNARHHKPPLTTVWQDFPSIGAKAYLLTTADRGPELPLLLPRLTIRRSTAVPAAKAVAARPSL